MQIHATLFLCGLEREESESESKGNVSRNPTTLLICGADREKEKEGQITTEVFPRDHNTNRPSS